MNEIPADAPIHKRRVRYKGTHPKRFEEKYKELAPELYHEDVQKVMLRGQTPAGMHRSICVQEILKVLSLKPGMVGLDCTFGYGGHSAEMLQRIIPNGKLIALDVDAVELPKSEARLRALGYGPEVLQVQRMNFAGIKKVVAELGRPFDFILADLGVSSMQIDTPQRGFSFKVDAPLDLRLNPTRGKPAAEYLRGISVAKLEKILFEFADEPYATPLSVAMHGKSSEGLLETTMQLRELIAQVVPDQNKDLVKQTCQRVFQALRIAVNDEFVVLEQLLQNIPDALVPGGKVAILTFHSGEDRRVKKSFQAGFRGGIYQAVAPDPIRPSSQECHENPRARSAKLRWAIKS